MISDVLVMSAFRRPTFRTAVAPIFHGAEEPWDSPPFIVAGAARAAGLSVSTIPFQNLFPGYTEVSDGKLLESVVKAHPARLAIFAADHFIASRSTASLYGVRIISNILRKWHPGMTILMCGRLVLQP